MNNDLISREALKEKISELIPRWNKETEYGMGRINSYEFVIKIIDSAPSVEPEKALIANVTFDEDKLKEIVQTEVIDKIKNGELVLKAEERPQGEWIEKQETPASVSYYCSNCKMSDLPVLPYCPWCGAKMKGGAE